MLPFLPGRVLRTAIWGKVLKRGRRPSRGIARWLATVAFVLFFLTWIASIRFTMSVASNFASSPTQPQYWIFVYAGRMVFGENKVPGGGMGVETEVYAHTPSMAWSLWYRGSSTYRAIAIPLWAPTLLAGSVAAWCWRSERRRRRLAMASSCASCGYSRAGLAADARCPECGAR